MRIATLAALAAAFALVCPRAALATAGTTTVSNSAAGAPGTWSRKVATISGTTLCTDSTGLTLHVDGAGAVAVQLVGSFTATLKAKTSVDGLNWTSDLSLYPDGGGAAVTSLTAAGTWTLPVLGKQFFCLYASAYTSSPTITVETSAAGSVVRTVALGSVTATAPTNTTLTAATATKVFAATAGVCQIACQNIDATDSVKCGETSAVSATVGLKVTPGQVYTEGPAYGGDVYCYPVANTPAVSCQATSCQ